MRAGNAHVSDDLRRSIPRLVGPCSVGLRAAMDSRESQRAPGSGAAAPCRGGEHARRTGTAKRLVVLGRLGFMEVEIAIAALVLLGAAGAALAVERGTVHWKDVEQLRVQDSTVTT